MKPVTPQELKERLKKEKPVEVEGMGFVIRKAPLLLLAEPGDDLWELARKGQDALSQRIRQLVQSPSLPRMRRVLLAGVVEPRLAEVEDEGAACVDLVLSHYALAAGLFLEIVNFSLEGGGAQPLGGGAPPRG